MVDLYHYNSDNSFLTKGAFHVSELTGQPIPILMRISLLIKTNHQISQIQNIIYRGDGFLAKPLGKSLFHCQKVWSGHGPAGQFRLLVSALSLFSLLAELSRAQGARQRSTMGKKIW